MKVRVALRQSYRMDGMALTSAHSLRDAFPFYDPVSPAFRTHHTLVVALYRQKSGGLRTNIHRRRTQVNRPHAAILAPNRLVPIRIPLDGAISQPLRNPFHINQVKHPRRPAGARPKSSANADNDYSRRNETDNRSRR